MIMRLQDELRRARGLFLSLTFYEAFEHAVVFRHVKRSDGAPSLEESMSPNKLFLSGNFIGMLTLYSQLPLRPE